MQKRIYAAVLAILMCATCGCAASRRLDQWKCDNLGWCCFGVCPSAPPACEYYVPAEGDIDACCPPDAGVVPAGVLPAEPCQNCR